MDNYTFYLIAITTAISSLAAAIVSIVNAVKSADNGHKLVKLEEKNDAQNIVITEKANEIHSAVNSNLSEVKAQLKFANDQIKSFQAVVELLEKQSKRDHSVLYDSNGKIPPLASPPTLSVPVEVKVVNPPEHPVPVSATDPKGNKK